MTEDTVGGAARSVNPSIEIRTGLRGIPRGLISRAVDVRDEISLSFETWQLWKLAGLKTIDLGAASEIVLTDWIHDWAESGPVLPPRPKRDQKPKTVKKKGA